MNPNGAMLGVTFGAKSRKLAVTEPKDPLGGRGVYRARLKKLCVFRMIISSGSYRS